jgi:hypothetical protein
MKSPSPIHHLYISLIKSVIRVAAGLYFVVNDIFLGGVLLIAAEVLGVLEEIF